MSVISHRSTAAAVACLILAAASPALAAGLTAQEQKLVAAAAAEEPRTVELLERLVNTNSGTMNLAGVEKVGQMMRAELEPLGFQVRWIPMTQIGRAGHLVAVHKGSGKGKRMLLIGHIDTVFEPSSPFQRFVRKGDIAEGPGTTDMKGGLAVMVSALRAMQAAGTLKDADIEIVLTGDEERVADPVAVARKDMIEAAGRADMALEFESLAQENGQDMGSIARRSSTGWTLKVTAKSGHSSGIFNENMGYGAIYETARIIDAFREEAREPNATFNVGLLLGGAEAQINAEETGGTASGKDNIVPAVTLVKGDLRTLSNEQTERIRGKMREIVSRSLDKTKAEIVFDDGYPAMAPTEGSRRLLAKLNEVNRDLGLPIMGELDPMKRGAGDIAFVAGKVDGLIGFGTAGEGSHAPGETVDLTSLDRQTKRAAVFMSRMAVGR